MGLPRGGGRGGIYDVDPESTAEPELIVASGSTLEDRGGSGEVEEPDVAEEEAIEAIVPLGTYVPNETTSLSPSVGGGRAKALRFGEDGALS
jgi:hypothetical protein